MSGWLLIRKKEMTKIWVDDKFVPVTIAQIIPQEIVRYKTQEKDGYIAAVIGAEKKEAKDKKKGQKISYKEMMEFEVDESFVQAHEAGKPIDMSMLENIQEAQVIWRAKGKGYQGAMKIFHLQWGSKTHGSKFHRHVGSMGNRKPRRTQKGHPHAGHMGNQKVTIKKVKIVDTHTKDNEQLVMIKWSLPGAYNGVLKLIVG